MGRGDLYRHACAEWPAAENLGLQPLSFAQYQMDATGALNVLRLITSDGQTYEFRRE